MFFLYLEIWQDVSDISMYTLSKESRHIVESALDNIMMYGYDYFSRVVDAGDN